MFGCVAFEGKDQGPCIGFVHWLLGAGYHTEVAVEDPSLARWLSSPESPRVASAFLGSFGVIFLKTIEGTLRGFARASMVDRHVCVTFHRHR